MKNKLYKIGFFFTASMFISLLFASCTNDEIEEQNANAKVKIQVESSVQPIDSSKVNFGVLSGDDGDPSNPKPPRR